MDPPNDLSEKGSEPTRTELIDASAAALDVIRLQAEEHPLIDPADISRPEEYVNHLMHLKAYDEALSFMTDKDVLDVGCNTGYGTLAFTTVARRVAGVDVSENAIATAKGLPGAERVEFSACDGLILPFADDSFDVVTSFQVVEHIYDPGPYFREIARVVRPGGTVIFTTPNAATRLFPGMTPWNEFHVREYLADELEALLKGFFDEVRVRGMFGTPTLYETEIARVDRRRREIRARERAAGAAAEPASPRSAAAPRRPDVDIDGFRKFTVADLFYADTDLDRAIDLMAVCTTR